MIHLVPFIVQMLCSSSSIKNCTTGTSTPKSAWVAAQFKHNFFYILVTQKSCKRFENMLFCDHQGGPTLDQRFESYYNYCNLFNYILSKGDDYCARCPHLQLSTYTWPEFVFVYRCWWPCTSGAAKPVAVGHHWRVHLPGRALSSIYPFTGNREGGDHDVFLSL